MIQLNLNQILNLIVNHPTSEELVTSESESDD